MDRKWPTDDEAESKPEEEKTELQSAISSGGGAAVKLNQRFGKFGVFERLGRGGMGDVYRAHQQEPDRWVALKIIQAGGFSTEDFRRRFKLESEAIARLKHPNIVTVYESGEVAGTPYFTMPLLVGDRLPKEEAHEKGELRRRVALFTKVVNAVEHAHRRGVLHRDLKPSNILLDDEGEPFVADFGLAKLLDSDLDLTIPGAVMGSPSTMAPEQAAGKRDEFSTATDVYGLGTILYQLLTGELPFRGENAAELIKKVLYDEVHDPRSLNPIVDHDLAAICITCLEKRPKERYASAEALSRDLRHWLNNEPIEARPITWRIRLTKWVKRSPAIAALVAALVAASVIGGTAFAFQYGKTQLALGQYKHQLGETKKALTQYAEQLVKTKEASDNYFSQLVEMKRSKAELQSATGDPSVALAHWADLLRFDPTNNYANRRIQDLLTNRNFAKPLALDSVQAVASAKFAKSPELLVATTETGNVVIWDGESLNSLPRVPQEGKAINASLSANGEQLAVATDERKIEFYRLSGSVFQGSVDSIHRVHQLLYCSSGDRLISQTTNGIPQLWDTEARVEIELEGVQSRLRTATSRFDKMDVRGDWAAAFERPRIRGKDDRSHSKSIHIWSVTDGRLRKRLELGDSWAGDYAFNPVDAQLAVATGDGRFELWNHETGERVFQSISSDISILRIAYSRNGRLLATGMIDGKVHVWDLPKRELVWTLEHDSVIQNVEFHPTSDLLLVVTEDHRVSVWDVGGKQQRHVESFHQRHSLKNAWFTGTNENVLTVSVEGETAVWRTKPPQVTIPVNTTVSSLEYSPDGGELLGGTFASNAIVWNVARGVVTSVLQHSNRVYDAEFNSTGTRIVSAGSEMIYRFWGRGDDGRCWLDSTPFFHRDSVRRVAFSPDDRYVFSGGIDKKAFLWDLARTSKFVGPYMHAGWVVAADFSPSGTNFVTGSNSRRIALWRTDGRTNVHRRILQGRVTDVGYSPDGKRIFAATTEGELVVWDASEFSSGAHEGAMFLHDTEVRDAGFGPDSNRIVSGCRDGSVRIWDLESGRMIGQPMLHTDVVEGVIFNKTGDMLVSWSRDGTARVWDGETTKPLSSPLPHDGGIRSGALSPDGIHFASGGEKRLVKIWKIAGFESLGDALTLAKKAESLGGFRFNEAGQIEAIPLSERFSNLRKGNPKLVSGN